MVVVGLLSVPAGGSTGSEVAETECLRYVLWVEEQQQAIVIH